MRQPRQVAPDGFPLQRDSATQLRGLLPELSENTQSTTDLPRPHKLHSRSRRQTKR
jgi:hypothetical protein